MSVNRSTHSPKLWYMPQRKLKEETIVEPSVVAHTCKCTSREAEEGVWGHPQWDQEQTQLHETKSQKELKKTKVQQTILFKLPHIKGGYNSVKIWMNCCQLQEELKEGHFREGDQQRGSTLKWKTGFGWGTEKGQKCTGFGSTHSKPGTIQRLAWPEPESGMQTPNAFHSYEQTRPELKGTQPE